MEIRGKEVGKEKGEKEKRRERGKERGKRENGMGIDGQTGWSGWKENMNMKRKLRAGRAKPGKVKGMARERKKKGKITMGNRRGKRIDGRVEEGQKTLELRK